MMVEMRDRKPEVGTEHRGRQLRDQFLHRVGLGPEPGGELTTKATLVTRPMRQLVGERGPIMIVIPEEGGLRHRDLVLASE
jgi:hypothetical protein